MLLFIAFMLALEVMSEFRLFPLPSIFNFRRATLHPRHGPKLPVLLNCPELVHIHNNKNTSSDISISTNSNHQEPDKSIYQSLAIQSSYNIFEDCYHDFTNHAGPMDFQCDRLVL